MWSAGNDSDTNTSEGTTMKMAVGTLGTLLLAVTALAAIVAAPRVASADDATPLLCAIQTVMECDSTGECQRQGGDQPSDFPPFLRVNVAQRVITDGKNSGRKTEIKSVTRLDGRLILQGGENGRGWSATIVEDTGRLAAGIVADDFTFAIFGACMTP
jgi:hypothetical protein